MKSKCLTLAAAGCLLAAAALAQGGPGRFDTTLLADQTIDVGVVSVWNSPQNLMIQVEPTGDWKLAEVQIWVGYMEIEPFPLKKNNPDISQFPYKREFEAPGALHQLALNLQDDLGFSWGANATDLRTPDIAVHADLVRLDSDGLVIDEEGAWAFGAYDFTPLGGNMPGWWFDYLLAHPRRGHFVDSPVFGLGFDGPTQHGVTTDESGGGGFTYFPGETLDFSIPGLIPVPLGSAPGAKWVSPLDLYGTMDTADPRVVGVARVLQTLDQDSGNPQGDGKIVILPEVAICFGGVVNGMGLFAIDYGDPSVLDPILAATVVQCNGAGGAELAIVDAEAAQGNLESGLNASGIFRKNISKTEEFAEDKQQIEVMPVYLPGLRSNGDESLCIDVNEDGLYTEGEDTLGVPYQEWRLTDASCVPTAANDFCRCDPRDFEDPNACQITLVECRDAAKPIVVSYTETMGIYDGQVTTDFWPGRFSTDVYAAISRDDGTTWKRMNVSRMADLSSFDLETEEPFPGTCGSPHLKVDDNYILMVWQSKFCRSGNPRYSITRCDDPETEVVETIETGCAIYCRGNAEQGTEVCEPDYPYDDDYFVTDIWGVRGAQQSVDYDEVDDVADLGIGEIPFSCLWATRGVIVTAEELAEGTFASLERVDDPTTEEDESVTLAQGDIVWFKPERLTSGRRDAYVPVVGSARGAGFAIAWQEDPSGLRPGKGKGPGEGWSGAISNHKTDIWYSYITREDFARVDANFIPGGPGDDPNGQAQYDDKPGVGRPKAQVPFSLPVRISDNDMVNTDTLKVVQSSECVTPPGGLEPVCFPEVLDGSFVPLSEEAIAPLFCGHPDADPATCCDPDDHQGDPNCEGLEGLYGNLKGTKRYAYLAKTIDEYDNATGKYVVQPDGTVGDGVLDYGYVMAQGGTLELCDTTGGNGYMDELPGTSAHERWFGFANAAEASKLVCVSADGRLLDGDVSASRPNIQMYPYNRSNGTRGAWVLLAYEESKGMGHSLAAEEHLDTDNPEDEIVGDSGQDKPVKQDLGKNVLYHSFDIAKPDLVSPGHIVNLPALCGGLYPTWCDDRKTLEVETDPDNPSCTCTPGQPVPLHFEYPVDRDGDPETPDEWLPDPTKFLQYRTEIARRVRFLAQAPGKVGSTGTLGAIIFKQGQEGQGRPADVFIRRILKRGPGNPYKFENIECTTYLDQTFALPGCPNDGIAGYNCNVWGEATGDRLCGGVFTDPYGGFTRRDQVNLTSADIEYAVDAGPVDETPEDPTDDLYGTNKVLIWSHQLHNLGNESYGLVHTDGTSCDVVGGEICPAMYSNARSHRGFIRGDFLVTAYAFSPNWAAARIGNDRYNFYVRKSFDGGRTWTTTPTTKGGVGVSLCPEWRSDPTLPDPDGNGNLPPEGIDPECDPCAYGYNFDAAGDPVVCVPTESSLFYPAGAFEPARNMSEIKNNSETSSDPRVGGTPEVIAVDGRDPALPPVNCTDPATCAFVEDFNTDNTFFVAWGTGKNQKLTGGTVDEGGEADPLDIYYTRTADWGDTYLKVPWAVGGENSNQAGEVVWRYQRLAWGEEEQGECQLKATADGSKAYAIYHELTPVEDPFEVFSRWYPWELEESLDDDVWFRRLIFWPED